MTVDDALTGLPPTPKKRLLSHYSCMVDDFRAGEWEDALARAGKVVEATMKLIWGHVGNTPPPGRMFKMDTYINGLSNIPSGTQDDCLRLGIPRACRHIYDLASNRGGRHDPGDVDPNKMDATAAVSTSSWVLAELIRYNQKGGVDPSEAQALAESLVAKIYPVVEEVEGRFYLHTKNPSAPDVVLATMAYYHPSRLHTTVLEKTLARHGFNANNIRMALRRIRRLVDDDGQGNCRLLTPGLRRGEEILHSTTM